MRAVRALLLVLGCNAAYFPAPAPGPVQQQMQGPDEPQTSRIAWLEYLGNIYVEVNHYQRAQKCIDEIRRLSGVALIDASLARLAIDGISRRMRGFILRPPKRNIFEKIKNAFQPKQTDPDNMTNELLRQQLRAERELQKQQKHLAKSQHQDYWQSILAGQNLNQGEQRFQPPKSDGYYRQGNVQQPGPSYPIDVGQAREMRRMIECPTCAPMGEGGYQNYGQTKFGSDPPESLQTPQNFVANNTPNAPYRAGTVSYQQASPTRDNYVYNQGTQLKSTDAVHALLFQGQLDEANRQFAQLIMNSTSSTRPVYRLELVLSLIDMDLTDGNDCVPLWEADWRLNWRDKLKIVDIYRSCKRSDQFISDSVFSSIRKSKYSRHVEARIKTIMNAPDALYVLSRVPSPPDFYQCGACYARRNMSLDKMQRLLVRAEHDANVPVNYRQMFKRTLQLSFQPDRFDPRVSLFVTVFPRDLAFSVITGDYQGLYTGSDGLEQSYMARSLMKRPNDTLYRALKNPDPVPSDRQQVLLDAFADGSPEQLAAMMNEHKHELIKSMLSENSHLNMQEMMKQLGKFERDQKKGKKKVRRLKGKGRKMTEEEEEMQKEMDKAYDDLQENKNELLDHLGGLLQKALQTEAPIEGSDQFGMSFHDFGTQPLTPSQHRKMLKQISDTQKHLIKLKSKSNVEGLSEEEKHSREQLEYLEEIEKAQQSMASARERIEEAEASLPASYRA